MGFRVVRLERQGLGVVGQGILELPLRFKDVGEVIVGIGIARPERQGTVRNPLR